MMTVLKLNLKMAVLKLIILSLKMTVVRLKNLSLKMTVSITSPSGAGRSALRRSLPWLTLAGGRGPATRIVTAQTVHPSAA